MDNISENDPTYDKKKLRYMKNYYTCFGTCCSVDWRETPELFIKRTTQHPIKKCWDHLNLEPKYYKNKCQLCSFLGKYYLDKSSVKNLLTIYKEKGDEFQYTDNDRKFIKSINIYNKLIKWEDFHTNKKIACNRSGFQNQELAKMEDRIQKMQGYFTQEINRLKKRIQKLEKREADTEVKEVEQIKVDTS